jgi:SAM-dependent MidA family methyltransferase
MACGAPHTRQTGRVRTWSEAWEDALYGPSGFFLREVPLAHFRTNAAVPLFAEAVRRLLGLVDDALGHPDPFDVVDLGAGRGELLEALPDVPARWRLIAVDLAPGMRRDVPRVTGVLLANEWLDSVPLDVLDDGRLVLVSPSGEEQPGAPMRSDWASRWWPDRTDRVELGASRDLAWAAAVARVDRGLALAVDYGHTSADRRPTLTGYLDGRQVRPVPDGTCDLTAHVALDSVAAATGGTVVSQRDALQALGVDATLPPRDSPSYAVDLARASQARELLDPGGLGGFGWVLNPVGVDLGWMRQWTS